MTHPTFLSRYAMSLCNFQFENRFRSVTLKIVKGIFMILSLNTGIKVYQIEKQVMIENHVRTGG